MPDDYVEEVGFFDNFNNPYINPAAQQFASPPPPNFDPNINPGFAPIETSGGAALSPAEYAGMQAVNAAKLAAMGIGSTTRRQAQQASVQYAGGGMHTPLMANGPVTKLFPATKIPDAWKMKHQKARGGHIAFISRTEAAYFTRKASCNSFVRAWNDMISHLGSAASFDQLNVSSLLAAVLQAASGAQGVANNFKPPLNGQ